MSKEIFADHSQVFLLPPALEDWVGEDHPVRFIRDFVSCLDLVDLGFQTSTSEVGRPRYSDELLLSVWLYGYVEKIRSSRKLEHACRSHMPLIWLTSMNVPDHNTLWRFWRDNKKALQGVFKQSVHVAQRMGLVGMVTHALDGTKIPVHSSSKDALHREDLERVHASIEASIAEMEAEVDAQANRPNTPEALPEALHAAQERRAAIAQALGALDEADAAKHLLPSEPEARLMKAGDGIQWAYNAQAVVDDTAGIVVAQDVVNSAWDNGQLVPMVEQAHTNTEQFADHTLADAGYRNTDAEVEAHERGHKVLLPAHGRQADDGSAFHKSRFDYDAEHDVYRCPQGKALPYSSVRNRQGRPPERVYRCRCYQDCPVRAQCSPAKHGRTIVQHHHHEFHEQQRTLREQPEIRALLQKRKAIIEPLFGWIKQNHGFRRWTVRNLDNVQAQWALLCLAINLKKLYHHWKVRRGPTSRQRGLNAQLGTLWHAITNQYRLSHLAQATQAIPAIIFPRKRHVSKLY